MVCVVGVRFKLAGKVYYFDPGELPVAQGDRVVVETVRGVEYGQVVIGPKEVPEEEVVQPLKRVIRIGNERDDAVAEANKQKEKEAFAIALKKIEAHNLDMYLVDVEYTFDGSKIIFYFTAEGRVDFRELVRDLASVFRTRIEMRQIGVRDEAKLLGGIGPCGRVLCCTSFLGEFAPVSIRMAKDQNLSLNPSKISGLCGRLMCCLRFEQETYEAAKKDPTLAPGYVPPQLVEVEPEEVPPEDWHQDEPEPVLLGRGPEPASEERAWVAQADLPEKPARRERKRREPEGADPEPGGTSPEQKSGVRPRREGGKPAEVQDRRENRQPAEPQDRREGGKPVQAQERREGGKAADSQSPKPRRSRARHAGEQQSRAQQAKSQPRGKQQPKARKAQAAEQQPAEPAARPASAAGGRRRRRRRGARPSGSASAAEAAAGGMAGQ